MSRPVDYYLTLQSPWTYLGHQRFVRLAKAVGAPVRVLPVDFSKVFAVSGGLPLGKRAQQRQAYRLVELRRFAEQLEIPLNLHPAFFPVASDDAARLVLTVGAHDGADAALQLSGAIGGAVWAQERNIADNAVLGEVLTECGLDSARLAQSKDAGIQASYEAATQQAIDAGVFGAPSYVIDGEIFWGQDRLDFVERKLMQQAA